jgi:alkanesulfonate monooxygenase SsuD/methylene tetrahydromethanopterin reductase-like flavin-dependent oxidoreductase (luciferase family)
VVPKPVQQPYPPIRVAANSVDTFELMGRLGLPIFAASQVNPFARIREFLPIYREHRKAAGHPDNGGDDVTVLMPFYVGESVAGIRRDLEPSIQHLLHTATTLFSSTGAAPPLGDRPASKAREKFGRLTYDKFAELMGVFDTPEASVERLGWLHEDFGMGRAILWFNPGGQVPHKRVMRSMELFAAKVMPHFAK